MRFFPATTLVAVLFVPDVTMSQEMNPPKGQLLLRTLAMPADTNANGDIFGGWIMSQLDLAGGILAKEISSGRIVTVSVSSITFKKPVRVGDVVCCYGECTRIGRTSMSIDLEVWQSLVNVPDRLVVHLL